MQHLAKDYILSIYTATNIDEILLKGVHIYEDSTKPAVLLFSEPKNKSSRKVATPNWFHELAYDFRNDFTFGVVANWNQQHVESHFREELDACFQLKEYPDLLVLVPFSIDIGINCPSWLQTHRFIRLGMTPP